MTDLVVQRWVLVRATPGETWDAVATPGGLAGWFAGTVSLDPQAGGLFSFSGPDVLGGGADTEVGRIELPSLLEFDWRLLGVSTRVTLRARPVEGGARVDVAHAVPADVDLGFKSGSSEGLHAMWSYLLGCLKGYLELGAAPYRLRYPAAGDRSIEQSMAVGVPAGDAFAALTEPGRLDAWLASGARVDPRPGGVFSLGWGAEQVSGAEGYGPSTIVEFEPARCISYAWNAEGAPTVVTWRVEGDDASARITLVHSGFLGDTRTLQDYTPGWADYMEALAIYLATGQPFSDWAGRSDSVATGVAGGGAAR